MTYYSPIQDTLLFDGTDLRAISGVIVNSLDGMFAPGTRRGQNDVVPRRRGQVGAQLPYDAYNFEIPITVLAATRHAMLTVLAAVGAALQGTGGLGTLERRLDNGVGGYVSHTAAGQFSAFNSISTLNAFTANTVLTFVNLDGAWTPDSGTTWLVP
jgi:hypothetical protein